MVDQREERKLGELTNAQVVLIVWLTITVIGIIFWFIGFVTKALWNWLMPKIFGLPKINFWEAWGLMLLSALLLWR